MQLLGKAEILNTCCLHVIPMLPTNDRARVPYLLFLWEKLATFGRALIYIFFLIRTGFEKPLAVNQTCDHRGEKPMPDDLTYDLSNIVINMVLFKYLPPPSYHT